MALVGRATLLWIAVSFFLLFVVLKLDGTTTWSWYAVFSPIWILDFIAVLYLVLFILTEHRNTTRLMNEFHVSRNRKFWLMAMYIVKLVFCLILCAKFDGYLDASYYYIFIPLWIMLSCLAVDSSINTWQEAHKTSAHVVR